MLGIKLSSLLLLMAFASLAKAQVKAGTMVRAKVVETQDSIEYYETDFSSRQKSYMDLLAGTWTVSTMKKNSQKDPHRLIDVALTLNKDSSFTGIAACNKIWGKFTIRGTSIKFGEIASSGKTCAKQEEENTLLQLLRETVSNYSVTKPSLLLRNGSGVIVFEAARN